MCVGPGKVPEGEALRRPRGLGRGPSCAEVSRAQSAGDAASSRLAGRLTWVQEAGTAGSVCCLGHPRREPPWRLQGSRGAGRGRRRGLDPPGPALCSVAHGSQGLRCLPSPKLLDRTPPPSTKAPSSGKAQRGHSGGRRERLPGALTPLCPAQPRLCLWSGRGPGRERSQVRHSAVLQGSSSGDWLEAVWFLGRLGDSMGSILAPPVPWWPEEGGPAPLPVLPCGASGDRGANETGDPAQ